MKKTDDQIDFNFSRPLDIQRNLDVDFLDIVLSNFNLEKKNPIFDKHLKLLIIELFYCWIESSSSTLPIANGEATGNSMNVITATVRFTRTTVR